MYVYVNFKYILYYTNFYKYMTFKLIIPDNIIHSGTTASSNLLALYIIAEGIGNPTILKMIKI